MAAEAEAGGGRGHKIRTCASGLARAPARRCLQGESSTGTHQTLGGGLGEACKAAGTLLVVDTVASAGGVPLFADQWGGCPLLTASGRAGGCRLASSWGLLLASSDEWGWWGQCRVVARAALQSTCLEPP